MMLDYCRGLIAGPIPEEVGDLGYLKLLKLDSNELTGKGIKRHRLAKHSASSMLIFSGVFSWVSNVSLPRNERDPLLRNRG